MQYEITVRHFAQRTRKNLKTITDLSRRDANAYFEVTQLINSSIGLLMFPQQEFFQKLPDKNLDELKKEGWPIPEFEYGAERTSNLRQLIRYMRNSFAHFNIDFKPEGGKIAGVYLWNKSSESEPPDWLCYLSIAQLEGLFVRVSQIAEAMALTAYKEVRVSHVRSEIARSKR